MDLHSPSPSPIRYFDLLPNETLSSIVEFLSPFNSDDHRSRQATLCSLCLSSKRLQAIAKPLLYQTVVLESKGDSKNPLFPCEPSCWKLARGIVLRGIAHDMELMYFLERNLESVCYRLEKVVLDRTCMALLRSFVGTSIRSLHINGNLLVGSLDFSFPHLEHLSLHDFDLGDAYRDADPKEKLQFNLPALKHLAVFETQNFSKPTPRWKEFFATVIDQLISISVDVPILAWLPKPKLKGPHIVADVTEYDSHGTFLKARRPQAHGLRITSRLSCHCFAQFDLPKIVRMLETEDPSTLSIKALYLPSDLCSFSSTDCDTDCDSDCDCLGEIGSDPQALELVNKIIKLSRDRGIATSFEERSRKSMEVDGFVSQGIVRRSEERWTQAVEEAGEE